MDRTQHQSIATAMSDAEAAGQFLRSSTAMVLTNPHLTDNPIVYVNSGFEQLTGYSASAAVGRNCRFLQGVNTKQVHVDRLRRAIEAEESVQVDLHNYRANGEEFLNRLMVSPIYDDSGQLTHFIGLQRAVDRATLDDLASDVDAQLTELQHRVKNHLSMIIGLIRMQARESNARGEFAKLSRRIEALQLLYEEMTETRRGQDTETVTIGAYLGRVVSAVSHLDGRAGVRVNSDIAQTKMPIDSATRVGLILSEVLTNAFQHAFVGRDTGLVEVRLSELGGGGARLSISDDGIGMTDEDAWPNPESQGGKIVESLVEGLDATLDITHSGQGTIVTLDIPNQISAEEQD